MTQKNLPTDLPIRCFVSPKDFGTFLEAEHATASGIHLKIAKKSSGIPSITGAEAVEVALCYGWIDGQANSFDGSWFLVRYTPRRAKSIWSKKNVNTVERLSQEGRMQPAGIAAVNAAKADGRWDRAYAGPATITVSDDFSTALSSSPPAEAFFGTLNKTCRYSVLWRVETASPQARAKRIEALIQLLAVGKLPGDRGKDQTGTKSKSRKIISESKKVKMVTKEKGTKSEGAVPRRSGLRSRPTEP